MARDGLGSFVRAKVNKSHKTSLCFQKKDPNSNETNARSELCNKLNQYGVAIDQYVKKYKTKNAKSCEIEVISEILDDFFESSSEASSEVSSEASSEASSETSSETSSVASPQEPNARNDQQLTTSPNSTLEISKQNKRSIGVIQIEEVDFDSDANFPISQRDSKKIKTTVSEILNYHESDSD